MKTATNLRLSSKYISFYSNDFVYALSEFSVMVVILFLSAVVANLPDARQVQLPCAVDGMFILASAPSSI